MPGLVDEVTDQAVREVTQLVGRANGVGELVERAGMRRRMAAMRSSSRRGSAGLEAPDVSLIRQP